MTRQLLQSGVAALFLGMTSLYGAACVPDFDDDLSTITGPRVLALRAEPAEGKREEPVLLTALVAGVDREVSLDWGLCNARKPLTELGPVNPVCLLPIGSEAVSPLGPGEVAQATVPLEACRTFGPIQPDAKPGEPAGRPVDPDPTGGYYQPFVAWLGGEQRPTLGAIRLTCDLAGDAAGASAEFNRRYRRNENPSVGALEFIDREGAPLAADSAAGTSENRAAPGERVRLRVSWPACPREDSCGDSVCGESEDAVSCAGDCSPVRGCKGAENYAWFDPAARIVSTRRESMRVSWFASGGRFADERSDQVEAEPDVPTSENTWTAPNEAGSFKLWIVLRDDRGGVGWQSYTIAVGP